MAWPERSPSRSPVARTQSYMAGVAVPVGGGVYATRQKKIGNFTLVDEWAKFAEMVPPCMAPYYAEQHPKSVVVPEVSGLPDQLAKTPAAGRDPLVVPYPTQELGRLK
uniref:Uncharacterized protein n=1 Tax=Oryza punctata TaxID=4537 RepID=A0A0E0MHP5_ORYPU